MPMKAILSLSPFLIFLWFNSTWSRSRAVFVNSRCRNELKTGASVDMESLRAPSRLMFLGKPGQKEGQQWEKEDNNFPLQFPLLNIFTSTLYGVARTVLFPFLCFLPSFFSFFKDSFHLFVKLSGRRECWHLREAEVKMKWDNPWKGFGKVVVTKQAFHHTVSQAYEYSAVLRESLSHL